MQTHIHPHRFENNFDQQKQQKQTQTQSDDRFINLVILMKDNNNNNNKTCIVNLIVSFYFVKIEICVFDSKSQVKNIN